jgi:hypothetical protein
MISGVKENLEFFYSSFSQQNDLTQRLFALAFATSLCHGDVPSLMFYDQMSLRDHYVKCIENNKIQPFPSKSKRGSIRNASKLIDLYLK